MESVSVTILGEYNNNYIINPVPGTTKSISRMKKFES